MRPINTIIEFKQIIGRGTRLYDGKDYFTIWDFVKAYHHFNDPEWSDTLSTSEVVDDRPFSRMNVERRDLQALADLRIEDARALLEKGRWAGAYYLLGYAVECALKACVARRFREHEVPDKQVVIDFYTHKLEKLLAISELKNSRDEQAKSNASFDVNWKIVGDWSEVSRYDPSTPEAKAVDLFNAVTDPENGVLTWLKTQW